MTSSYNPADPPKPIVPPEQKYYHQYVENCWKHKWNSHDATSSEFKGFPQFTTTSEHKTGKIDKNENNFKLLNVLFDSVMWLDNHSAELFKAQDEIVSNIQSEKDKIIKIEQDLSALKTKFETFDLEYIKKMIRAIGANLSIDVDNPPEYHNIIDEPPR